MSSHKARRAIVDAQVAARGKQDATARADAAEAAADAATSVPKSRITTGDFAIGRYLCTHCHEHFAFEAELGGCTKRVFHSGKFDSGIETVWNGPDYIQYDARDSSWTCCDADFSDKRCGCRARRHELVDTQQQPRGGGGRVAAAAALFGDTKKKTAKAAARPRAVCARKAKGIRLTVQRK